MDDQTNQKSTLQIQAEELRRRTDSICRFSGGVPTFEEGLRVFRDFIIESGVHRALPLGFHFRPCENHGDEHEVWHHGARVIKLTYPNFFGLKVVYRPDEDARCLPCEYFERWQLHNEIFGDNVHIPVTFEQPDGRLRVSMVQRAVMGTPATNHEIHGFFVENGWRKFTTNDGIAWLDEERCLVVSDTHQGNLVKTPDGILAPIDFRIQKVDGAILDGIKALIR